ncbi:hypothetical protein MTO96_041405 [Rhipicephalus appendiculatus]
MMSLALILLVTGVALTDGWSEEFLSAEERSVWLLVPPSDFDGYMDQAQEAVYEESLRYKHLFHILKIKKMWEQKHHQWVALYMKIKVAESVCLSREEIHPSRSHCPPTRQSSRSNVQIGCDHRSPTQSPYLHRPGLPKTASLDANPDPPHGSTHQKLGTLHVMGKHTVFPKAEKFEKIEKRCRGLQIKCFFFFASKRGV